MASLQLILKKCFNAYHKWEMFGIILFYTTMYFVYLSTQKHTSLCKVRAVQVWISGSIFNIGVCLVKYVITAHAHKEAIWFRKIENITLFWWDYTISFCIFIVIHICVRNPLFLYHFNASYHKTRKMFVV